MIDFDEEVAKFQPSMEIEKVEDTVSDDKLRDISDVLLGLAKNMNDIQRNQGRRGASQNGYLNYEQ